MTITLGHEEVSVELPLPTVVEAPTSVATVFPVAGAPGTDGQDGQDGAPGAPGEPGPPGAGAGTYVDYNFAIPSTSWVINHGMNTFGVQIETFDQSGNHIEGAITYLDANTVEVTHYYPTAGLARVIT